MIHLLVERSGIPGGSDGKESTCHAGDPGSMPGSRRLPGEGNGHPLQYSCPENPVDRGAWRAAVPGVTKGQTRLSSIHFQRPVTSGCCTTKNKGHSSLTRTPCWARATAHTPHTSQSTRTHRTRTLHTTHTHARHTAYTHTSCIQQ